ncbi:MAG TPA: hypothetical protein VIM73_11615 [Polyangiaceae bacterium]
MKLFAALLLASLIALGCSGAPKRSVRHDEAGPLVLAQPDGTRATMSKAASSAPLGPPEQIGSSHGTEAPNSALSEAPHLDEENQAAEWEWIKSRFPETASYRRWDDVEALVEELMSWAKSEKPSVYSPSCERAAIEPSSDESEEKALFARSPSVAFRDGLKHVSYREVEFGARGVEYCGTTESYEKSSKGKWVSVGSGGLGCARNLGFTLSRVTADAAWYDDWIVELSVGCTSPLQASMPCSAGGTRTCADCAAWGIVAKVRESNAGMHRAPRAIQKTEPADCSIPCPRVQPQSSLADDLGRAERAVRGQTFVMRQDPTHPVIFRTLAACRVYLRKHRGPEYGQPGDPW